MRNPLDTLTQVIDSHIHCWHDGHGCGTMSCDGQPDPRNLEAVAQVKALRDVTEEIAKTMVLASTPGFLWRRMHEIGPKLDAALSPFFQGEEES